MESNAFSLKEKIEYYKKKWKKDHISIIIISAILWTLVIVSLLVKKLDIVTIISIGVLLATCVYVVIYNKMMKYIEEKAYKKIEENLLNKSKK